jgi:hypothetical protein
MKMFGKLKWQELTGGGMIARTAFGNYIVSDGKWIFDIRTDGSRLYKSPDQYKTNKKAMKAAQKDFKLRTRINIGELPNKRIYTYRFDPPVANIINDNLESSCLKGIPSEVLSLIPDEIAISYKCLPLKVESDDFLLVAVADSKNKEIADDLRLLTNKDIRIVAAEETELLESITEHYNLKNEVLPGFNYIDLGSYPLIDVNVLNLVPEKRARALTCLPVKLEDEESLLVAIADPRIADDVTYNLGRLTNLNIITLIANQEDLMKRINLHYGSDPEEENLELSKEGELLLDFLHWEFAEGFEVGALDEEKIKRSIRSFLKKRSKDN